MSNDIRSGRRCFQLQSAYVEPPSRNAVPACETAVSAMWRSAASLMGTSNGIVPDRFQETDPHTAEVVMLAYARLTLGEGFQADRAIKYYAQRFVGVPALRRIISSVIAARLREKHGDVADLVLGPEENRALNDLERDGLALLDPLLSPEQLDRMTNYFLSHSLVGPGGRIVQLEDLSPGVSAAAYSLEAVLDCPGMIEALNTPHVLRIGSRFLGCKPTLSSVGVRWSFPRAADKARSQEYHRDLDDWRFFKLFVYLTDVDADTGPHSYVLGSHKTAFGVTAKAYGEQDLLRRYGAESVTRVLGARGTTFVADTLGIHCGLSPVRAPRLILQVQYSILPIYAFLYDPATLPTLDVDVYCNRLLVRRHA
jgi:hypothetical protein